MLANTFIVIRRHLVTISPPLHMQQNWEHSIKDHEKYERNTVNNNLECGNSSRHLEVQAKRVLSNSGRPFFKVQKLCIRKAEFLLDLNSATSYKANSSLIWNMQYPLKQHSQKKGNLCLHCSTLETGEIYTKGKLLEYLLMPEWL